MILVTLCQEGEKEAALPGSSPACAPIKRLPGLFVGPRARREPAAGLSLPGAPLDRPVFPASNSLRPGESALPLRTEHPPAARTGDPFFRAQGCGSASPRTSCLCISPFTGEYPAPQPPPLCAPCVAFLQAPRSSPSHSSGAWSALGSHAAPGRRFFFFLFAKVGLVLGLKHPDKEVNSKPRGEVMVMEKVGCVYVCA